jgi:DNA polymerase-1
VLRNAGLMVLRRDVPVEADVGSLAPRPDLARVRAMFTNLEFKTMITRVTEAFGSFAGNEVEPTAEPVAPAVELTLRDVATRESLDALLDSLAALPRRVVAALWDDVRQHALVGLAVVEDGRSGRVAWLDGNLLRAGDMKRLAPLVTHDAKPLLRWSLDRDGGTFDVSFDTAVAAYLLDPQEGRMDVAAVAERFGGIPMTVTDASPPDQLSFGDAKDERLRVAAEAVAVDGVVDAMRTALADHGASDLFETIEMPLIPVLARMEHVGVGVDRARLEAIAEHLTVEVARLTAELHALAGRSFNLNSPTQLRTILFEERKLSPGKKTKTGYSTDAATLEKIRDQWPEFIDPLLRYRELEKLRSTYGVGLLDSIGADGRIHATFNQMVARTGRLSSDAPNLHNIPVRSDEGRVFREAFVPVEGCELLVADYNQIELRCIAHLADDPGLIEAFTKGEDIHTSTAARVFGVEPSAVTLDMRSQAKMVSYGLAYGMEAFGLSQRLGIAVDEAAAILDSYFAAFPNVRRYMDAAVEEARSRGYTETLFGRRRPIPELNSSNFRIRQVGERQAMNAAIQGLAADIFKVALVRVQRRIDDEGLTSRIILQVHDEIIVEAPLGEHAVAETIVVDTMKGAAQLKVPLEVNLAWGSSWAAAKG